jgi:hypothetical protein
MSVQQARRQGGQYFKTFYTLEKGLQTHYYDDFKDYQDE